MRLANSRLKVVTVLPSAVLALASNHLSWSDSAEPMTVTRAELRACRLPTRVSCSPAAKKLVDGLGLLLGVVRVSGARGPEDRVQQLAAAEGRANGAGKGEQLIGFGTGAEEILDI